MQVKLGMIGLILIGMLLLVPMVAAQSTVACTDGTPDWGCSASQPGYVCVPDQNGNWILQNVMGTNCQLAPDTCGSYQKTCACTKTAGYTLSSDGNSCVKSTCTDTNGQTLQTGVCGVVKPNRCMNGQLVNDSAFCHCPTGSTVSGSTCAPIAGCRYVTASACPSGQYCNFTASVASDGGTCMPKPGCNGGINPCDLTYQYCDINTTANGVCLTAPGKCQTNIDCSKGQACVSNACQAASTSGSTGVSALAAPVSNATGNTTASSTSSSSSPLACCPCIPAVGAAMLVGVVLFKRNENEE